MEHLKMIKEQLISQVQTQMNDLKCVDTKELGEVVDMIKDLSEAIYYCEIYDQMKNADESCKEIAHENNYYYTEHYYDPYRDLDRNQGRMYYSSPSPAGVGTSSTNNGSNSQTSSNSSQSTGQDSSSYYTERDYPIYFRDEREGKSPIKRKMYMESKATGQDSAKAIKELENYMQDLTSDMMEMINKASPEEKVMLQKKMNTLAAKIQNV